MNVVDKQSFSVNSLCNECSYERAFIFIETSQESSIIAPIAVVTLQGLNEMAVIVVMIQTGFVSFVFYKLFYGCYKIFVGWNDNATQSCSNLSSEIVSSDLFNRIVRLI